jgi:hypothetical protein
MAGFSVVVGNLLLRSPAVEQQPNGVQGGYRLSYAEPGIKNTGNEEDISLLVNYILDCNTYVKINSYLVSCHLCLLRCGNIHR